MNRIFWAADSTVQYNSFLTYPQTGMGQMLHLFLKPEIQVCNKAINGRSTKSFMDQGRLAEIEAELSEGDFLFIQFGHNDEKIADPLRYTTPFGTFAENLEIYVKTALGKKAFPVIITPIERRVFDEKGVLSEGMHGDYVKSAKQVGEKLSCPVIDLNAMSREILSMLGPVEAKRLHVVVPAGIYPKFPEGMDDETHLSPEGAVVYCSCLAKGLQDLGGVYKELLLEGMELPMRVRSIM